MNTQSSCGVSAQCDQDQTKIWSAPMKVNDASWFCWEGTDYNQNHQNQNQNHVEEHHSSRLSADADYYHERHILQASTTSSSSYIPNSGIHSERLYYNECSDVPSTGAYYYNEHQYPPRQHSSKYASGGNDNYHSSGSTYKSQNSDYRPDLYPHTSPGQKEHGEGRKGTLNSPHQRQLPPHQLDPYPAVIQDPLVVQNYYADHSQAAARPHHPLQQTGCTQKSSRHACCGNDASPLLSASTIVDHSSTSNSIYEGTTNSVPTYNCPTHSAPLYFHDHYKNTPSTINTRCHHLTAPPPPSAINSQQQQEQYQQNAVNCRAVTSSFTTPAFYKYPHPSNDDHGDNYNKYNKEFVEDQPQTSRKKRKSKPAAHEPRRPLSAYNFFFSEEKEFVVALLPDRSYTVTTSKDQDASSSTAITTASSSTSEDVDVTSASLPDYDPKNMNASSCADDTRMSTIPDQQLVLMQSTPAKTKEIHRRVSIGDTTNSSSSMLVVYDMDIAQIHDYLVDIERRISAETLTALRHKIERQTQQTLLVHLEGDRKKKSHKKSHGKISFQKLASIIGMRWRGLTDEGKKRYFELAKEDQGRFRRQQTSR
jgi:hypothetical protein